MGKKQKDCGRREFLTRTASGMAALGLLGCSKSDSKPAGEEKENSEKDGQVVFRTLGRTGFSLPVVSMGVMNASNPDLVKKSYEMGVRHFDTAANYMRGRNEEMVGNALKDLGVRKNVVIGTKVFIPQDQRALTPTRIREIYLKTADESLARLKTDYVDILYSHDVGDLPWLNNAGVVEALQHIKKQGKARFIGFTTHTNMTECINDAVRSDLYDVILTSFNYALWDDIDLHNALNKAYAKKIGLIAMKTQCMQYWYREELPSSQTQYYKGKMLQTAVLKWVLHHPFITTAVPGYTTFQHMEEDFSVAHNLEYTSDEKKFLEDRNVKVSLGYCRQCRHCIKSCPKGVDIPALMRTHMYAACYSNFYQARDSFDSIPRERSLGACRLCTSCKAKCINRIDMDKRINELKLIYA